MGLPGHLLIIRLSALGDVAMSVPVIRGLKDSYPDMQITVISRPQFKPLFNDIPRVNFLEADVYGKHKGFGLLRLAKEAQGMGIEAVADLHNVIRTWIMTRYFKWNGIRVAAIDKGRSEKKALTRKENKIFKQLRSTHQRYVDVFAELGFSIDPKHFIKMSRRKINEKTRNLVAGSTQKWIGIAPFAAYKSKMYPLEMMEKVIHDLNEIGKYRILLFGGGPYEINIMKKLEDNYDSTVNIAGELSFEEELDLISNLDLMLSMDSANGHLAAIYGIPVITLWGVTHPFAGFRPIGQPSENQLQANRKEFPLIPTSVYGNKFPRGYEKAMASITPESILKRITDLL